ncbi:MAG: hypothetical protein BACD_01389 [Bacteroides rodentium]
MCQNKYSGKTPHRTEQEIGTGCITCFRQINTYTFHQYLRKCHIYANIHPYMANNAQEKDQNNVIGQ